MRLLNPVEFQRRFWPQAYLYDRQWDIVFSVRDNVETHVVAANKMGKDFVAGFIVIWFFVSALKILNPTTGKPMTCRVVTTSVSDRHLDILWGEMQRWLATSRIPLLASLGGPLLLTDKEIRRADEVVEVGATPLNYVKGMVAKKDESMAGHHADMTLFGGDEASGLEDRHYEQAQGWAQRFLIWGNANPCENFFRRAVEAGDLAAT